MKILIVSDAWHPQVNGVVRTYEHLAEELERLGHTVQVIGPCSFPITMPLPGYNEIRLTLRPYARLARMIDTFKPDHIHIATEATLGLAARRYARLNSLDFSSAYHTHFPAYIAERLPRPLKAFSTTVINTAIRYLRWFHAPSSALLLATPSLERQLKDWGFTAPMHRMTRGVNLDVFHPANDPADKSQFLALKKPIALNVGRVAIEKGLDDFLRMDWPGTKVIVGDGPSRRRLQRQYPDAHFVGVKKGADLAAHVRSADVFVFPSRTDTFGIVLIEALASGLPIAGYPVMGPQDIVTEPGLGALDDDLAAAARRALASPGNALARHNHTRTHYTWALAAKQFEAAIGAISS